MAAYFSVLEPGDRMLGMNLAQGGHLTHGMALNFSGRCYEVHAYGVRQDDERIDYDALERAGPRGPAQADRRRRQRLSADHRLRADGRDRPLGRGAAVRRHGPRRRSGRRGCPSQPVPARRHRHDDDPQDAARARGGLIFSRDELPPRLDPADFPVVKANLAATIDRSVFPGIQGGPLMHVIAGKAVALQARGRGTSSARTSGGRSRTRGCWPRPCRPGRPRRLRRHRQPPDARRRDAARGDRQGGGAPPRRDRDHGQQERHPVRPACRPTRRRASASGRRPRPRGFGEDEMREVGRIIIEAIRARDDEPVQRASPPRSREIVRPLPGPRPADA